MTDDVLQLPDRLWRGEVGPGDYHPVSHLGGLAEICDIYDEPEFIVHTIWRLYGGWWDGNPASLKPAPERALAAELAALAGGARALADRALALLGETRPGSGAGAVRIEEALRLAGHLAELAWLAAPGDQGIGRVRHEVFTARADAATSTMAKGVFRWAARESLDEA